MVSYTIIIFALGQIMMWFGTNMTTFWIGLIAFPVIIYSFYQVCKKRLRHMGYSARVFWIFLFLMFFLWIGCFIYFGVGEHFTLMFEYRDQHMRGEITNDQMLELIKGREVIMAEKLEAARRPTEILLTIPAAAFLLWLAVTPGKSDRSEKQA